MTARPSTPTSTRSSTSSPSSESAAIRRRRLRPRSNASARRPAPSCASPTSRRPRSLDGPSSGRPLRPDAAANAVSMTEDAKRKLRQLDSETDAVWAERGRLIEDVRSVATALFSLAEDATDRFPEDAGKASATAETSAASGPRRSRFRPPRPRSGRSRACPGRALPATPASSAQHRPANAGRRPPRHGPMPNYGVTVSPAYPAAAARRRRFSGPSGLRLEQRRAQPRLGLKARGQALAERSPRARARPSAGACLNRWLPARISRPPREPTPRTHRGLHGSSVTQQWRTSTGFGSRPVRLRATRRCAVGDRGQPAGVHQAPVAWTGVRPPVIGPTAMKRCRAADRRNRRRRRRRRTRRSNRAGTRPAPEARPGRRR